MNRPRYLCGKGSAWFRGFINLPPRYVSESDDMVFTVRDATENFDQCPDRSGRELRQLREQVDPSNLTRPSAQRASTGDSPLTTAFDKKLCYQLPSNALAFRSAQSTRLAFRSAKELREAILEQNALDIWEIYKILDSAATIAEGLCNDTGAKRIRGLKQEIEQRLETAEAAGSEMRGRLTSQLRDICRQREEIDKKRDVLTCEMLEKKTEEKAVLSQKIEAYLESNFEQVQKDRKT